MVQTSDLFIVCSASSVWKKIVHSTSIYPYDDISANNAFFLHLSQVPS